jgi:Zn-dependent protease
MNLTNIGNIVIRILVLLIAVVIHEYSHGRMAEAMGDSTARRAGRLTLNPLPHLDPFYSVLLPLFLIISGSPVLFAAAKPVPINPMMFHDRRRGLFLVGLAGPASNLVMAFTGGVLLTATSAWAPAFVIMFLSEFVIINCLLAVFNLIPLPPLDGSRLAEAVMPREWVHGYTAIEPFGIFIIFGLFFLVPGFFEATILPAVNFLATVFMAWPQVLLKVLGF